MWASCQCFASVKNSIRCHKLAANQKKRIMMIWQYLAVFGNIYLYLAMIPIPPPYQLTNRMIQLISQIEVNRSQFTHLSFPKEVYLNLKRQSLLKSSVYSAQIEGNTISLEQYASESEEMSQKQYEYQEIENIITTLTFLQETPLPEVIDIHFIQTLHKMVMHKLVHDSHAGKMRTEPSAIFDQFGNVVYMTPPPSEITSLLVSLLTFLNTKSDSPPLIQAALAHMSFEKIHPFMDGNGRVGRLLLQVLLARSNYHFDWLLSVEELLQEKKQSYYSLLDQSDATGFIEYILQLILEQSDKLKGQFAEPQALSEEDTLLPRRKEILLLIREHKILSFDQIKRRFLSIPDRTLRYNIKQLEIKKYIKKIGSTRGVMYSIK